jgi:lipopolysaccharide export system permease protein
MRGDNTDVYRQISDNEFIYVNSFNTESKTAFKFLIGSKKRNCIK